MVGGSVFARSDRGFVQTQVLNAAEIEVAISANGAVVLIESEVWQRGSDGRYNRTQTLAPIPGKLRLPVALSADGTVAVLDREVFARQADGRFANV